MRLSDKCKAAEQSASLDFAVMNSANVRNNAFSLFVMPAILQNYRKKRTIRSSGSLMNSKSVVFVCTVLANWDMVCTGNSSYRDVLSSPLVFQHDRMSAVWCYELERGTMPNSNSDGLSCGSVSLLGVSAMVTIPRNAS